MPPRSIPTNAERVAHGQRLRRQKALMKARITVGGSVLVKCPYCLIAGLSNDVDVTRFVDAAGKREVTVNCIKGHALRFRTIDQWREERQQAGIQERP